MSASAFWIRPGKQVSVLSAWDLSVDVTVLSKADRGAMLLT